MKWFGNSSRLGSPWWIRPGAEIPARVLRRMGYCEDSRGIIDRFIQTNGAWENHRQHTRNFILQAVTGKKIEKLAVYGSGWLLDLPLDELSEMAGSVTLFDLVHPPQVIRRIQKLRNVRAVRADISGGAVIRAYQAVKRYRHGGRKTTPEEICSAPFIPEAGTDFSVSLNILSQIGTMITDYLKMHLPCLQEETDRIIYLLQQAHLQLLMPGRSCLITDIRELNYDFQDKLSETCEMMLYPLPHSMRTENWEWLFDPYGGYKTDRKTVFQVVALEF
jgi:hypothetical protein